MTISETVRLGLPIASAPADPFPSRTQTNLIHQRLEDRVVTFGHGPLSARPAASQTLRGSTWWDGVVLWWCDPENVNSLGAVTPAWVPMSTDAYINVQSFGAVPLAETRIPATSTAPGPDYDPYAAYRAQDCAAAINAAINAAMAPFNADQFPGRYRRTKPIFFPPGTYALFSPISVVGHPTNAFPSDISIIGSFPNTRLMAFGPVAGTNNAGAATIIPGFPTTGALIGIDGWCDNVYISGLVLDGYATGNAVVHVSAGIDIEADAAITISDVTIEQGLRCGAGLDLGIGTPVPFQTRRPSFVSNIIIRGGMLPATSRDNSVNGAPGSDWYAGIVCSGGRGTQLSNIHIEHYQWGLTCGGTSATAIDVMGQGLSFYDNAQGDIRVVNARSVVLAGISSDLSARLFGIDSSLAPRFVSLSGSYGASNTGYAGAGAALHTIGYMIGGASDPVTLHLVDMVVRDAGTLKSIVTAVTAQSHVHMCNVHFPQTLEAMFTLAGGVAPRITASNFAETIGTNPNVPGNLRDKFSPEVGTLAMTVATTPSSAGITMTDIAGLPDAVRILGDVIRALKSKGIMP